jgi:hypothetical protein
MTSISKNQSRPRTLEHELEELLRAAKLADKQARAVAVRLGWDGRGASSLATAAATEGYSRERVRQLEERVRANAPSLEARPAHTEAALRLIEELAPIATGDVGAHLVLAGISRRRFEFSGLLRAAEILGVDHCLEERDGVIRRYGQRLRQEAA